MTPEGVPRKITPQDEAALRECLQYFPGAQAAAAAAAGAAGAAAAAVPHGAALGMPCGWHSRRWGPGLCRLAPANQNQHAPCQTPSLPTHANCPVQAPRAGG